VIEEVTNAHRIECADLAIKAFSKAEGISLKSGDGELYGLVDYEVLSDLLCDLRHWADAKGIDYDAAATSALIFYGKECQEEN